MFERQVVQYDARSAPGRRTWPRPWVWQIELGWLKKGSNGNPELVSILDLQYTLSYFESYKTMISKFYTVISNYLRYGMWVPCQGSHVTGAFFAHSFCKI